MVDIVIGLNVSEPSWSEIDAPSCGASCRDWRFGRVNDGRSGIGLRSSEYSVESDTGEGGRTGGASRETLGGDGIRQAINEKSCNMNECI